MFKILLRAYRIRRLNEYKKTAIGDKNARINGFCKSFGRTFVAGMNVFDEPMRVSVVHVTAGQVRARHVQFAQTTWFHYLTVGVQQVQGSVVHWNA